MTYLGHVVNGQIVPDGDVVLPEGAAVRIHLVPADQSAKSDASQPTEPTLYDRLEPIIGVLSGLPSDLAANHDHYIHGRPKP
jgi:hypothetical protein